MTSTQIKKLNAYPEWNTLPTYESVLNFVQSINEDEEPQYPENLNNSQKARYRQKFSKDFNVEPFNNQLTIFYQPHIQGQDNQRIKIPVARPNQNQEILKEIYNDDKLGLGVGLDQFYCQVCSQYIGIKRDEARAFLRQQGNYQISRPIKKAINQPILSKHPMKYGEWILRICLIYKSKQRRMMMVFENLEKSILKQVVLKMLKTN
jgi:hypothetical protein